MPNATVKIVQVNSTAIDPEPGQALEDAIRDLEQELNGASVDDSPVDLSSTQLENRIGNVNQEYVVVGGGGESPRLQVPANEEIYMLPWDGSGGSLLQLPPDSLFPGVHTNSNITIRSVGPTGEYLGDNTTLETPYQVGTGLLGLSPSIEMHYVKTSLAPGFYEVSPEGGGFSYTIVAGNAEELMRSYVEGLEDRYGALTNRSQAIQDYINDDVIVPETVEAAGPNATNPGEFSFDPSSNVDRVGLIAYKAPLDEIDVDPTNLNVSYMKDWWENTAEYNGSLYVPTEIEHFSVGNSSQNITVETHEVAAPSFPSDPGVVADAWEWFRDALDNYGMTELSSLLQEQIAGTDNATLRQAYEEQLGIVDNLDDAGNLTDLNLADCGVENLRAENASENIRSCIEDGVTPGENATSVDVTYEDLLEDLENMEQNVTELKETIDAGDGSAEIANETLSAVQSWPISLDPDQIQIRVHYSNGTTDVVDADSEYVSLDDGLLGGTTVRLQDYPVGDAAAAMPEFRVAANGDLGQATQRATNPSFGGSIASLDAIDLSSLNPGPSEHVQLELHPSDTIEYGELQNVTVHAPDGSEIDATVDDEETAHFVTNGEGEHHVEVTYSNREDDDLTTTFRVAARADSRDVPAQVRVEQSPIGTYALTGDSLSGGSAAVADGGDSVQIAGHVSQDADVPAQVRVYTAGIATGSDVEYDISVLRGDDGQTVNRNVRVVTHTAGLDDSALVWRTADGEDFAMPQGESTYGQVDKRPSNSTVKTVTGSDGRVTVRTIADPGYLQRATHWGDRQLQRFSGFSLPSFESPLAAVQSVPLLPSPATALTGGI